MRRRRDSKQGSGLSDSATASEQECKDTGHEAPSCVLEGQFALWS